MAISYNLTKLKKLFKLNDQKVFDLPGVGVSRARKGVKSIVKSLYLKFQGVVVKF